MNTEEVGGTSPLWLRSTTDVLAKKVKVETASSYRGIFNENKLGRNSEDSGTTLFMEMRN